MDETPAALVWKTDHEERFTNADPNAAVTHEDIDMTLDEARRSSRMEGLQENEKWNIEQNLMDKFMNTIELNRVPGNCAGSHVRGSRLAYRLWTSG